MSAHEYKKPGVLYRIFFKDPEKYRQDEEPEWQANPVEEQPPLVDIPIPQPYTGPMRPFGAAPMVKRWLKLTIASEDLQADIELTMFPVEIGSVQSSIQLNDKSISPRHAMMDLHNGILTITDTHSQNGVSIGSVWLNPGVPYTINPGDTILIGRTRLTILDFAGRNMVPPPQEPDITAGAFPPMYITENLRVAPATETPVMPAPPENMVMPILPFVQENEPAIISPTPGPVPAPIQEPEPVPEPEPMPGYSPEPALEPMPELIFEPTPEPIFEPIPEPEPINKINTIAKLMEEPKATLFRDMLGMKEPEPPETNDPPQEDETQPPEDERTGYDEPDTSEAANEEASEPNEPSDSVFVPLTIDDNIDETAPDSEPMLDQKSANKQELIDKSEPKEEQCPAASPQIHDTEQTIEEYMESLLSSSGQLEKWEPTPQEPPQTDEPPTEPAYTPEQPQEHETQASPTHTPEPTSTEHPPEDDEIPEDLTAEDFLEALIQKSSHRPPPKWKAASTSPSPPSEKHEEPPKQNKVCHKCSAANSEKDKFCGACGTLLEATASPPTVKAFCGQCGAKNVHKIKFCGECGYKLI